MKSLRGEALWDEELSLVCTMFVNPKTGTYEPKPAVFIVKEILDAPLKAGPHTTFLFQLNFSLPRASLTYEVG